MVIDGSNIAFFVGDQRNESAAGGDGGVLRRVPDSQKPDREENCGN